MHAITGDNIFVSKSKFITSTDRPSPKRGTSLTTSDHRVYIYITILNAMYLFLAHSLVSIREMDVNSLEPPSYYNIDDNEMRREN